MAISISPDTKPADLRPVYRPAIIRNAPPEKRAEWSSPAIGIQDGSSRIESASRKGVGEAKLPDIQVVAELRA